MRTKLLAFALSGFMAGYAGVCFAFATESFSTDTFAPTVSILVVSMVVIGGLDSITGAVLGAVYLVGLPAIFGTTPTIQILTSGLGLMAFILYLPGGMAELSTASGDLVRRAVWVRSWWRRSSDAGSEGEPRWPSTHRGDGALRDGGSGWRRRPLEIDGVAVAFGGVHALAA